MPGYFNKKDWSSVFKADSQSFSVSLALVFFRCRFSYFFVVLESVFKWLHRTDSGDSMFVNHHLFSAGVEDYREIVKTFHIAAQLKTVR